MIELEQIKKAIFVLTFFFFFGFLASLLFPRNVLAKVQITKWDSTIDISKEFQIDVSLTGTDGSSYRIGIAIHKSSSDEYFGLTKNNDQWIEMENANCRNLPLVTAQESSWSGQLTGKVVYGENDFDGSLGSYILRVVKYTSDSCAAGQPSEYSPPEINIILQDLNPPSPTPLLTLTSTPTPPPEPTSTPTPRPPTATPTPKPTKIPTSTPTPVETGETLGVGASNSSSEPTVEPTPQTEGSQGKKGGVPILPIIVITAGLGFIGVGVFFWWRQRKLLQ